MCSNLSAVCEDEALDKDQKLCVGKQNNKTGDLARNYYGSGMDY